MTTITRSGLSGILSVSLLLLSVTGAYSIVAINQTSSGGQTGGQGQTAAPDLQLKKKIEFFKDMSGGYLYTDRNTYNLQKGKVKVTIVNKDPKEKTDPSKRKTVGLIYSGDVLKEVVIEQ